MPATATCPGTISAHADAVDDDGGTVAFRWTSSGPGGVGTTFRGNSDAVFQITRSGTWQVRLDADDNEGERTSMTRSVTVTPGKPSISITGKSSFIVMREAIELHVTSSSTDCGTLTTTWDIISTPPGASKSPQNGFATGSSIAVFTQDEHDIGQWTFRATSTIAGLSDSKMVTVQVTNLPPRIAFSAPSPQVVQVGTPIHVATTILNDDDGGALTFSWELVQAPASAGVAVGPGYATGASLDIPTAASSAGTWVFKLTATDNDNAPNSSVTSSPYEVLVDALPVASVTGPQLVTARQLTTFDGSKSLDPDSPCPGDPMHCHVAEAGWTVRMSPGIVSYRWYVDVPFQYWARFMPGRVSDAFGIPDDTPTLSVDQLEPGDWVFRLEVIDGEGHTTSESITVTVIDPNVPPMVQLSPPGRFVVSVSGVTTSPIFVSGAASFDPDNLANGGSFRPGLGITRYHWDLVPPPGCAYSPLQLDGPSTLTLFTAGAVVAPACQGSWLVNLTVTDDDSPAQSSSGPTQVMIGNCAGSLCIDSPTTAAPRIVEAWDHTDVTVVYHLDSALYGDAAFGYGMYTELAIFPAGNTTTPVYTSIDPNVFASAKGGLLTFNWNGYTNLGLPVATGYYDVRVRLLDYLGAGTAFSTAQGNAIWMEVADAVISAPNGAYVSRDALQSATATARFDYLLPGAIAVDSVQWLVRDASGAALADVTASGALAGTVIWDGIGASGTLVPSGEYTFELKAFRAGQLLAGSTPLRFVIYRLKLEPSAGAVAGSPFTVYVNNDDDDLNGVPDSQEVLASGEDDIAAVNLVLEPALPGTLSVTSGGTAGAYRLWTSVGKAAPIALPSTYSIPSATPPSEVFVEGLQGGKASLEATFTTSDGTLLPKEVLSMDLVEIGVLEAGADAPALRIGRWDNAYLPGSPPTVRNSADPANLVEQDPRRFYVQVLDPGADHDSAAIDAIGTTGAPPWVTVETQGRVQDAPVYLSLSETGPSSALFKSTSQLLVTEDHMSPRLDPTSAVRATDDAFAVTGGAAAVPIPDGAADDRTHQADLSGFVRITYRRGPAEAPHKFDVPVCPRSPDERRRVTLQPIVFIDPATGIGVVDEAYVQAELFRARLSWQQACIELQALPTKTVEAPKTAAGVNILADRVFNEVTDEAPVVAAYAPTASVNVVYLFFVLDISSGDAWAYTRTPSDNVPGQGENTFVYFEYDATHDLRVLAHELGHALDNGNRDGPTNPQWEYYPSGGVGSDEDVLTERRISALTETNCRTVRPAGNMTALGSRLLTAY